MAILLGTHTMVDPIVKTTIAEKQVRFSAAALRCKKRKYRANPASSSTAVAPEVEVRITEAGMTKKELSAGYYHSHSWMATYEPV